MSDMELESLDSGEVHVISRVCQCCLDSSGDLKSMLQEYTCNGIQEVYQDMLHECFSIQMPVPLSGTSDMLICAACIDNLRNVLIFRQQIEETQKVLRSLEELQETASAPSFVEEEFVSEDEDEDMTHDSKNDTAEESESELVLQRALDRIKKNLKLLKKNYSEETVSDALDSLNHQPSQTIDSSDLDTEDKLERKRYLGRKNYAKNIPFKLEKTDRTCKVCSETFPSYKGLLLHMPTHYPNYICNYCGKSFILKLHLNRHVTRTHNKTRIPCPICDKLFKKESLPRHVRLHTGDKYKHRCYYCPEEFTSYSSRVNHMLDSHGHKANEYVCSICSKVFKVSSDLNEHMKYKHFGEKRHNCSKCNQRFFKMSELRSHMMKHSSREFVKFEINSP